MKVSGPACLWNRAASDGAVRSFAEAFEQVRQELTAAALGCGTAAGTPSILASGVLRSAENLSAAADVVPRLQSTSLQAAEVSKAHLAMLEDPLLKETVEAEIAAGKPEPEALDAACSSICAMFSDIDDEYLRARVDDVRDVFVRLKDALGGDACFCSLCPPGAASILASGVLRPAENLSAAAELAPKGHNSLFGIAAKPIIVAEELFPSDIAAMDLSSIAGILCARGSSTSHVSIIAHANGTPIQFGADISQIAAGDIVTVDDPMVGPSSIAAQVRAAGRKLYVNAGSVEDIRAAMAAGADGIGVFRTEFLFLGRDSMPTREEQRALYREALEACDGKPLILRLLDVGGDKSLPYLPMPREDNPFLGVRGVRFGLEHPELYETQLAAVADAVSDVPGSQLKVMIPMVCTVEEIRRVREILRRHWLLRMTNTGDSPVILSGSEGSVPLGIMIETPAAVFDAAALAAECDFFSIGTNDLTQYIMAADRGNASVAGLYDALSPAVRRAIELTVDAAHSAVRPGTPAGIPVGICGELASDPRATAFLLAAGLDSLSLSRL